MRRYVSDQHNLFGSVSQRHPPVRVFQVRARLVLCAPLADSVNEGDGQERGKHFREIVKKYATDRFVFTDGLELLDCPYHLAEDMVHPSLEGIRGIADKWSEIMKEKLF